MNERKKDRQTTDTKTHNSKPNQKKKVKNQNYNRLVKKSNLVTSKDNNKTAIKNNKTITEMILNPKISYRYIKTQNTKNAKYI